MFDAKESRRFGNVSGRSLSKNIRSSKGKKKTQRRREMSCSVESGFGLKIRVGCLVREREERVGGFSEERRKEKKRSFGLVSDPLKRQWAQQVLW